MTSFKIFVVLLIAVTVVALTSARAMKEDSSVDSSDTSEHHGESNESDHSHQDSKSNEEKKKNTAKAKPSATFKKYKQKKVPKGGMDADQTKTKLALQNILPPNLQVEDPQEPINPHVLQLASHLSKVKRETKIEQLAEAGEKEALKSSEVKELKVFDEPPEAVYQAPAIPNGDQATAKDRKNKKANGSENAEKGKKGYPKKNGDEKVIEEPPSKWFGKVN